MLALNRRVHKRTLGVSTSTSSQVVSAPELLFQLKPFLVRLRWSVVLVLFRIDIHCLIQIFFIEITLQIFYTVGNIFKNTLHFRDFFSIFFGSDSRLL